MQKKSTKNYKVELGSFDKGSVEKKIEDHIRCIQSLIKQIEQKEMQSLFSGMLASVLSNPQTTEDTEIGSLFFEESASPDESVLSDNEMNLIGELSEKIEELYRITRSGN